MPSVPRVLCHKVPRVSEYKMKLSIIGVSLEANVICSMTLLINTAGISLLRTATFCTLSLSVAYLSNPKSMSPKYTHHTYEIYDQDFMAI